MKLTVFKTLLVSALLAVSLTGPVLACGMMGPVIVCTITPIDFPIPMGEPQATVPDRPWDVEIRFRGFTTFSQAVMGDNCAAAVRIPQQLADVYAMDMVLAGTNTPVAGLSEFGSNPNTGRGFSKLSDGLPDWMGFSAQVTRKIPEVSVDLVFHAEVMNSSEPDPVKALARYLGSTPSVIGAGSADEKGDPSNPEHPEHTGIASVDEVEMGGPQACPADTYDFQTGIFKAPNVEVNVFGEVVNFEVEMSTSSTDPFTLQLLNATPK
jgi:hypothetical protein